MSSSRGKSSTEGGKMLTKSGYQHKKSYKGHLDVVNCFVVAKIMDSKDKTLKEYIFTGSSDKTIKQFDSETTFLQYTFPCIEEVKIKNVLDHAHHHINQALQDFSGSAANKKQEGHEQGVCCLAVSLDGKFLYSGSFDSRIIQWDLKDPNRQQTKIFAGHQEAVYRISIQEIWLLSVSRDKTLRVWNEVSGQTIAVLRAHTAPILSLVVLDRIAWTGSDDCSILQWEWQSGAQTQAYHGHTDGVTDLQSVGDSLYSCSFDSTVRMWEIKTGRCVRTCNADAGLRGLAIAAGKIFAAGNNAMLYIWDQNSTSANTLDKPDRLARAGLTMVLVEHNTVIASSADAVVRVWEKVGLRGVVVADHKDKVHACVADADTGMLYSASSDCTVCCKPIKAGVPHASSLNSEFILKEHTDRVLAVTITGPVNGKVLFTGSADKTIKKWELKLDGSPKQVSHQTNEYTSVNTLKGHTDWVSCLVVADGSLFSGSWDSSIRKWDVSTNRLITELLGHHDPVYTLAAVGGVLFSGARDCCVRVWRTDTCECLRLYEGHSAVVSSLLAVDPYLYTASWDKTIRRWDLATGRVDLFARMPAPVLCLLEHEDKIIAGCGDAKIRVYMKESNDEVTDEIMTMHKEAVNSLTAIASKQGLAIFSASNDNRCIQWEMASSSKGDVHGGGAGADPSLSAALAERIKGSTGVQRAVYVKGLATGLLKESRFLTQTSLDDPVPKVVKGWLWKQGSVFKRWSKRYYTLDKGLMLYYPDELKDEGDKEIDHMKPMDHLVMQDLISAASDDASANRGRQHCFTLVTLDRTIHLSADSPEDFKEWLAAFQKYLQHNNLQKKIAEKRATRKY